MDIYLTDDEVESLFDSDQKRLKNRDRAAYLYLRSRMDPDLLTATAGWKAISMALEERPVQGSTEQPFLATREAIRGILRRLEECELIRQAPNSSRLVESTFRFPLYRRESEKTMPEKRATKEQPCKKGQDDDARPVVRKAAEYPPDFLLAVVEYPARHISIDKSAAFRAWRARIKEGHTPEEIVAGIKRYKRFVTAEGTLGTQFVKMMASFLGKADPPFFSLPWKVTGHAGINRGTDRDYNQVDYKTGATPLESVDWAGGGDNGNRNH